MSRWFVCHLRYSSIFGFQSKSNETLNDFISPMIKSDLCFRKLFWLKSQEEIREGKSIFRKTSLGTNAIVPAPDGEILTYINGIEIERDGQIEEIFSSSTGLGPKQEILFSKIHALEGLLLLLPAIICLSYVLLLAMLCSQNQGYVFLFF